MSIQTSAKTIGTGLVIFLLVVVVVSQVAVTATDLAGSGDPETGALTTQTGSGTLPITGGETIVQHDQAQTSLGTAVNVSDGAAVEGATADFDTQNSQWTVCTFAQPAGSADNVTSTVAKYDEAAIIHNGTSDTYQGYFFDNSNRSDVDAEVAVGGTAEKKLVCLSRDNATIRITRNTSASATVQLDSDPAAEVPPNTGFNGTVDETRVYDRNLTAANKSTILAEPTGAIQGAAPELRLTYDARSSTQTSFRGFFAGSTAEIDTTDGSASIVDSFEGEPIAEGTDYEFGGSQNATLTVLNGGELRPTGAIVYATYRVNAVGGLVDRAISIGGAAFSIAVIGVLAMALNKMQDLITGGGGM